MADNYFEVLYGIDVSDKVEQKNGLNYLPWSCAWAEVKKIHPDAQYVVYENEIGRPWFDDGHTAWVKAGAIINNLEYIERLPIMDFKNKSIPAENVTSCEANKSIQRCITKAFARHGLGLYIYEGEDLPEVVTKLQELNELNFELAVAISKINEEKKEAVGTLVSKYEESKNPRKITDVEQAEELHKELIKLKKTKK